MWYKGGIPALLELLRLAQKKQKPQEYDHLQFSSAQFSSAHLILVAQRSVALKEQFIIFVETFSCSSLHFNLKFCIRIFDFVFGFWRSCLAFIWFICLWFWVDTLTTLHYTTLYLYSHITSYGRFCSLLFFPFALFRFLS